MYQKKSLYSSEIYIIKCYCQLLNITATCNYLLTVPLEGLRSQNQFEEMRSSYIRELIKAIGLRQKGVVPSSQRFYQLTKLLDNLHDVSILVFRISVIILWILLLLKCEVQVLLHVYSSNLCLYFHFKTWLASYRSQFILCFFHFQYRSLKYPFTSICEIWE